MTNVGLYVGDDLRVNTSIDRKIDTDKSTLKLYKRIDAQFTTNASAEGSVAVPHGLGYTPKFEVWAKHTAQYPFLSSTSYPNAYSLLDSANSYRSFGYGIESFADDQEITVRTLAIGSAFQGGADPDTTYHFRILIWVDLSQVFSGLSNVSLTGDAGFKVSKDGVSVFDAQEYETKYSTKYRAMQYYPSHVVSETLTLPAMWASYHDTYVESATYVDFEHNLGFPPRFELHTDYDYGLGTNSLFEAPAAQVYGGFPPDGVEEVSAWCDEDRVRVLFTRYSQYQSGAAGHVYAEKTINAYVTMFDENLAGEEIT